jgi:glycosyltransferase involved in cell wall biosynthesis
VLDVRPLQEPERTPITAAYLERLLGAFAVEPLAGESFVPILRAMRDDPTTVLEATGLPVAARRRVPPTSRLLRNAGLTLDSFLLRAAEVGTAARTSGGAALAVYHTAGGAVPLASGLPVVATLLDLAPWELPERYAATAAARLGHRLRARTLRDAARVIVTSRAVASAAQRWLHVPPERLAVIPLAADPAFHPAAGDESRMATLRARYDLPGRYLVFVGRYDARQDFSTLFAALGALREQASSAAAPVVVLAGAAGDEHADAPVVARMAARAGVSDLVRLTPRLEVADRAALIHGAVALVLPTLSDATGLAAVEALAVGVPVICSRVGGLAETVGPAGIVVEPRDPARLVTAIRAMWDGGAVARQVTARARERAAGSRWTWADVARETRRAYAEAAAGEHADGA